MIRFCLGICSALSLFLAATTAIAGPIGAVTSLQKISQTVGGFTGALSQGDDWGVSVASIGDLNDDGVDDLAVGSRRDDDGGTNGLDSNTGAVWILFLNADDSVASHQKISATEGGLPVPLVDGDQFGAALAALGDLDGDGVEDIAVGSPGFEGQDNDTGAVYILFLNATGTVKATSRIDDQTGLSPNLWRNDNFGNAIASLRDIDNDGVIDIAAAGAAVDGNLPGNSGVVYIIFLNSDGTVKGSQSIGNNLGGFTGSLDALDEFGTSLAAIGDLDGDGTEDLVAGAHQDDDGGFDRGAVYVLFLNPNGTVKTMQKISATSGGLPSGLQDADRFGTAVALIGDLDGPGGSALSLAVGAAQADDQGAVDAGVVWTLRLNAAGGVVDAQRVSATQGCLGPVVEHHDYFGQSLGTLGDRNGDGAPDLVVGAVGDDDGAPDRGAIYMLHLDGAVSVCGDAVIDCDEQCDDGNTVQGDACSNSCTLTNYLPCGVSTGSCQTPDEIWSFTTPLNGSLANVRSLFAFSRTGDARPGTAALFQSDCTTPAGTTSLPDRGDIDSDLLPVNTTFCVKVPCTTLGAGYTIEYNAVTEAGPVCESDVLSQGSTVSASIDGSSAAPPEFLDMFSFDAAPGTCVRVAVADGAGLGTAGRAVYAPDGTGLTPDPASGNKFELPPASGGSATYSVAVFAALAVCEGEAKCFADGSAYEIALSGCCGDGTVDTGEQCDDANTMSSDGCSSSCTLEAGCSCTGEPSACTCCGDGTIGSGEQCDDGNTINGDCCSSSCQFEPSSTTCAADENACTDDHCDGAGTCVHTPNTVPCDDGVFCNGADTCSGGTCSTHAGDPCPGTECNTCQEAEDDCTDPALTGCTPDANICTDDVCDGSGACAHPGNTVTCDDGLFCNGADTCSGGSCSTHAGDPCPGTECNTCQEAEDDCTDPAVTGCTPDANICTDDHCDGAGACAHTPNTVPCDDDDACTLNDQCSGGTCEGTPVIVKPACRWVMMGGYGGSNPKKPKQVGARIRENATVAGDVCGDTVRVGGGSYVAGKLVATRNTCTHTAGVELGPKSGVRDIDNLIVTGGANVLGKPVPTLLQGYPDGSGVFSVDCNQHAVPPLAPPAYYDTTGTDPLVADCNESRTTLTNYVSELDAGPCTAHIDPSCCRIAAGQTLFIGPGITDCLLDGEIVEGRFNFVCLDGPLIAYTDAIIEIDDNGNTATEYVLRISGKLQLLLRSHVTLVPPLDASRVLIYGQKKCYIGKEVDGAGALLCPKSKLIALDKTKWKGALLSGNGYVQVGDHVTLTHVPLMFTNQQ